MLPFPLVDEHSLPSPTGALSENATSQSIQLHISRARTRRKDPRLRPRFSGSTAAPSRPCLGNRIISQSSVQHGLGQPDGKSKKMSAAGTKTGCVKKICEYEVVWCEKSTMNGGRRSYRIARKMRSIWGKQGVRRWCSNVCLSRASGHPGGVSEVGRTQIRVLSRR